MKDLLKKNETTIFFILIALGVLITCINPSFLRADNFVSILKSNLVVGIMAMGMLVVMITGGIDLSVGSSISTIGFILGYQLVNYSDNLFLAFLIAIGVGFAIGFANYLIIAKLNVPPIVATLGTMSIISGLLLYFTSGNRINILPENVLAFSKVSLFEIDMEGAAVGIPLSILFFVVACVVTWFFLRYTRIGRGIYAVGGNSEFAKRVGFNSDRVLMFAYSFLGVMVGVAAFVSVIIYKQIDPSAFKGYEFMVIAVVVLGGTSIAGGKGSVFGTVLGVLLMGVIKNGLVLAFIPTYWQNIIVGMVILIAIALNAIRDVRKERNTIKVDI